MSDFPSQSIFFTFQGSKHNRGKEYIFPLFFLHRHYLGLSISFLVSLPFCIRTFSFLTRQFFFTSPILTSSLSFHSQSYTKRISSSPTPRPRLWVVYVHLLSRQPVDHMGTDIHMKFSGMTTLVSRNTPPSSQSLDSQVKPSQAG